MEASAAAVNPGKKQELGKEPEKEVRVGDSLVCGIVLTAGLTQVKLLEVKPALLGLAAVSLALSESALFRFAAAGISARAGGDLFVFVCRCLTLVKAKPTC